MQSDGSQGGGGGGATSITPVLLWNSRWVQQVILACNIALEINPSWVMLDMDLKNARTFCSRDRREEELELDVAYHYMFESFRALYGKTFTV
jgi:hypothetical protein